MQIIDDTAVRLMLPANLADSATANLEKCEITRDEEFRKELVVYFDHDHMIRLAGLIDKASPNPVLTEKVPSPMQRDYKYPGIFKPYDHQRVTAEYLSLRRRAFCFNEAGTGKTSAAIWAADYLMNLGLVRRVLVICPVSIMYSAWQRDIFNTAMHRTCGVAYGDATKRKKIIDEGYDFTIINYDGIGVVHDAVQSANFDLIIVDEANAYKNTTTKRWKLLAKIVMPSTWLWMMTGTPASQSPIDAFGLARMISPDRVPKFSTAWRDKVMYQVSRFKWIPKRTATDDVFYSLQPAIRYTKKECIDLPDVTIQTRDVVMTPQATKYYRTLKNQMLIEAAGEQVSAVNAAVSLSKLLQISGGAVYSDNQLVIEFDITPRLTVLKEVIDETSNKVVVFVPFTHTIEVVQRYLTENRITSEVINGSVSPKERSSIISRFQDTVDPRVLIIQPQAAAHGITLTAADTVVFWSPVMSVETYLQCIARIDRIGQKNAMTVVNLQGSEVERKMYTMLHTKVDSHQKLVDLYKQVLED